MWITFDIKELITNIDDDAFNNAIKKIAESAVKSCSDKGFVNHVDYTDCSPNDGTASICVDYID